MTGKGYIVKVGKIEDIEGADNIKQALIVGELVIISKDIKEGSLGILFDCATQLSEEFVYENNMYRNNTLNKDKNIKGYLEANRRIRPLTLRGVRCSALWLPIESLKYTGNLPKEGDEVDKLNGHVICNRYITPTMKARNNGKGEPKRSKSRKYQLEEHINTQQLARNINNIPLGSLAYITTKLHGTSGRVGVVTPGRKRRGFKFLSTLLNYFNYIITEYGYVVGSRRVIKYAGKILEKNGYHQTDLYINAFKEKKHLLRKGESVYFEIVGYEPSGKNIMASASNTKLKSFLDKPTYKKFLADYGSTTEFNYNQAKGTSSIYVYRITQTDLDGNVIELSWPQVKTRCSQLGINHVPEEEVVYVTSHEELLDRVNILTDAKCKVFPDHIKEGVCVRIDTGREPLIYKNKSFIFKVLEGIIRDNNDFVDTEEMEG